MSNYLEETKHRMEMTAQQRTVKMTVNRRKSKEKMLVELYELLNTNAGIYQARQQNPWSDTENSYCAGKRAGLAEARSLLKEILEKGRS